MIPLSHGRTFKVFHNTHDPAVFGKIGGLRLNETGDGFVTAFTMCLRFQGQYSKKISRLITRVTSIKHFQQSELGQQHNSTLW